jgi:transportin-3
MDAMQQVIAAINALYTSDDSRVRQEADRWLERWQTSSDAWSVANSILHDPNSQPEYTYFCAQTLKTKVQLSICPAMQVPAMATLPLIDNNPHKY